MPASVIGDLNSRRGQMQGQDMRGNAKVINAMVPLANMFGYVNKLRSMSQGRAQYTMQFDHYAAGAESQSPKKFRRNTPDNKFTTGYRESRNGEPRWPRKNSSGTSRTATSARSVTSITARRR